MSEPRKCLRWMTYAEIKAELDKLTPEQLAQRAVWSGDERGGNIRAVYVHAEDWIGIPSEPETWVPRSEVGVSVPAEDYARDADSQVCIPKGTVHLMVD